MTSRKLIKYRKHENLLVNMKASAKFFGLSKSRKMPGICSPFFKVFDCDQREKRRIMAGSLKYASILNALFGFFGYGLRSRLKEEIVC